jgi:hypothetical protein
MSEEDIVSESEGDSIVPHKLTPDDERLRETIGARLFSVLE